MRIPRLFQNQPLIESTEVVLDEKASHHLATVLRVSTGDPVILFNGTGGEYHGQVSNIQGRKVAVTLDFFNEVDRASPLTTHLGQVMGKGDRMDYALQKATELGVSAITPLTSERCEVKLKGQRLTKKIEQWRSLLIAACEQSGLNLIPELHPPLPLTQWLEQTKADAQWILHTDGLTPNPFQQPTNISSLCVAVGPEGGFSDDEVQAAKLAGFNAVTVGNRIWRTETAPVAILSLAQLTWGDFKD